MILLIDNYDSFSYNLFQLLGEVEPDIRVIRNDEMSIGEIETLGPDAIVLSPGPGRPEDAGICCRVASELAGKIPIMGVCLGHQAICQAHGATVTYSKTLMHGKQSKLQIDTTSPIFKGLPGEMQGARYHSLAVDEKTLPETLKVIARTTDGEVMGIAHKEAPLYGLQFHPESILTPMGREILKNFLGGVIHDHGSN